MDVVKAIKSSKNVFVEVVTENAAFYVKVYKKDLITQIQANMAVKPDEQLYVVTQFGRDAVYLSSQP